MVILITGVTSGFGRAVARRLVSKGHKVYGTSRSKEGAMDGFVCIKADSSSEEDVKTAVSYILEKEGRIDVLVNNAGMGIAGPLEFCSWEDCAKQMDVNFMGAVRYVQAVLPSMRVRKKGHIICISSIGGRVGLPYQAMYSASKFAIEGMCEALRLEVRQFGIKVTTVAPGDFHTGFTAGRKAVRIDESFSSYSNYRRCLEVIEQNEIHGLDPERLAKAVANIVESASPVCIRMVATFTQKLSVVARAILPRRLFAWVMKTYYRL